MKNGGSFHSHVSSPEGMMKIHEIWWFMFMINEIWINWNMKIMMKIDDISQKDGFVRWLMMVNQ
jgi:hypothetical protein